MYTKFIILDFKTHFTCGELSLHENRVNGENIISSILNVMERIKKSCTKERREGYPNISEEKHEKRASIWSRSI